MSKHSPGPWIFAGGALRSADGSIVLDIECPADMRGRNVWLVCSQPDARIIAAAPELFEALSTLVDSMDEPGIVCAYPECSGCVRNRAHAAACALIRRIEGG